jgi:hypothetical protein
VKWQNHPWLKLRKGATISQHFFAWLDRRYDNLKDFARI